MPSLPSLLALAFQEGHADPSGSGVASGVAVFAALFVVIVSTRKKKPK